MATPIATKDPVKQFIHAVKEIYERGRATEHSYRPALKTLLESINTNIVALNEPKAAAHGAPDFNILRKNSNLPIGHLEAKDPKIDLKNLNKENMAQKKRYLAALPNLIYTNCYDWEFYLDGQLIREISIATRTINPQPAKFDVLSQALCKFLTQEPSDITQPDDLANRMAGMAGLLKDVLTRVLEANSDSRSELIDQYKAFNKELALDIPLAEFADMYAETITYGMFAASLQDKTLDTFSREKAMRLLPRSNPFLRNLFNTIAGPDIDPRIESIINSLAAIFDVCNVKELLADFGTLTGKDDPFIHFYENFLRAYNPQKRQSRGVYYTPEPVVGFIIRAVDNVLQTEFGLKQGLADTSKITIDWDTGQKDKKGNPQTIKKDVHRVQILDPATGTGTFLAETIKQIATKVKKTSSANWSNYIEEHLIPRLHGFELLMSSYTMCHTKLDLTLNDLDYKPSSEPPRQSVWLTNSLEEGKSTDATLPFARWLSIESQGANEIKKDKPIMCVIGNPPYSGISQNMGGWIKNLIEDYKYVDGEHFRERKHWLQDDYVKFIRFGEYMINKNGEGVLAYITNHGYLDNPTFRGMRWHLLNSFSKIYILDLHGNANKQEVAPDGGVDMNVFDIQQGVSIIVAVKKQGKKQGQFAKLYHSEFWGRRGQKYQALDKKNLRRGWTKIEPHAPQYVFVPRDYQAEEDYQKGFRIDKLMQENVSGIVTARDKLAIDFSVKEQLEKIGRFIAPEKSDAEIRTEFFSHKKVKKYPSGDSRGWKLPEARKKIRNENIRENIKPIAYRPFDTRYIYYSPSIVDWGREKLMRHMPAGKKLGLVVSKQQKASDFRHVFVHLGICESSLVSNKTSEICYTYPLYLYFTDAEIDITRRIYFEDPPSLSINDIKNENTDKKTVELIKSCIENWPEYAGADYTGTVYPNLNRDIMDKIASAIGLSLGKDDATRKLSPQNIVDYIYAVLHCPAYRETYKEFLKSDFPYIPYPSSAQQFRKLSRHGEKLRLLHLMDETAIGNASYPFEDRTIGNKGSSVIEKVRYEGGKVWINSDKYFDKVPKPAWEFYIGGYQPAQMWLKARKGRELTYDDSLHYQKIIKILVETDKLMQKITLD